MLSVALIQQEIPHETREDDSEGLKIAMTHPLDPSFKFWLSRYQVHEQVSFSDKTTRHLFQAYKAGVSMQASRSYDTPMELKLKAQIEDLSKKLTQRDEQIRDMAAALCKEFAFRHGGEDPDEVDPVNATTRTSPNPKRKGSTATLVDPE